MLDCDQALELISAKLDGELAADEASRLDAHLKTCPGCRALLSDLQAIHGAMPGPLDVPADLSARIMEQVRREKVTPMPFPKKRIRWKALASAAAVLALVLLGAGSMRLWAPMGMNGAGSSGAAPAAAGEPASSAPGGNGQAVLAEDEPEPTVYGLTPETAAQSEGEATAMDKTLRSSPEPSVNIALVPAPSEQSDSPNSQPRTVSAQEFALADAGLTGPYCGILTLPAACLSDWAQREAFVSLDSGRAYLLSAEDFAVLSEESAGWDGMELQTQGEMISSDSPEGLVILTGAFE